VITYEISNCLRITGLPLELVEHFKRSCTYDTSPYKTDSNDVPEVLNLFKEEAGYVYIPRGKEQELLNLCATYNLPITKSFSGCSGDQLDLEISPKINYTSGPYSFQGPAVETFLNYHTARIQAPPGAGKTILSCLAMAKVNKGPVLFLAQRDRLLTQFRKTVTKALSVPEDEIGIIKAKKHVIKPITCGSLMTLGKKDFDLEALRNTFTTVFFDECHLSTALTYRTVLLTLAPERLYGLSATPEHYSSQELSDLMTAMLGEIVVKITEKQIPGRLTPETYERKTGRVYTYTVNEHTEEWRRRKLMHKLNDNIANDIHRNDMIVRDCVELVKMGYKPIICTNRVLHGQILHKKLLEHGVNMSYPYTIKENKKGETLTKVNHKQLNEDVFKVEDGELDGLIGTYTLFDTGFDCPSLSALLMAGPFSGRNTTRIEQVVGRILRFTIDKQFAIVFDYSDESTPNPQLDDWAIGRCDFYQRKYKNNHRIIPSNR
jgi:superfamily II DNA or RNA helicase